MRPEYISSELFHFVGSASPLDHEHNYNVLKKVLSSSCVSYPPHEKGWGKISYKLDIEKRLAHEELLVPSVTCFCDIPFNLLAPHLTKYGSFGLSFSRHQLTKCGARPVIYVPCRPDDWTGVFTGHTLLRELEATFRSVYEQCKILEALRDNSKQNVALEAKATTILKLFRRPNIHSPCAFSPFSSHTNLHWTKPNPITTTPSVNGANSAISHSTQPISPA